MIPIRLNLLSPEKRRFQERTAYVQFTKNMLEILFIAACLSSIGFIIGLNILEDQFRNLSSKLIVADSKYALKNREIERLNADLSRIEAIQHEYVLWTPLLFGLANNIPAAVTINSMTIDAKGRQMSLAGLAPARADLLEFKARLSSLPWVQAFNLPPSALVEKEHILFSLSVPLRP